MAGTRAGGLKTAAKLRAKDPNFYRKLGAKSVSHTGGFYANRELAARAGKIGGTISRRKGTKNNANL